MVKVVYFDVGHTLVNMYPSDKKNLFKFFCMNILGFGEREFDYTKATIQSERFYQKYCNTSDFNTLKFWKEYYYIGFKSIGLSDNDSNNYMLHVCKNINTIPQQYNLIDGALIVLQFLKSHGYKIGAISNWNGKLEKDLSDLGILQYFDIIVDSKIVGYSKPDRRIFQYALGSYLPHEAIMVGDLYYLDILPAESAGMCAILFDSVCALDDIFTCNTIHSLHELFNHL